MAFDDSNDALKDACAAVSILDAWRELGLPDCPNREGLYKSPLREDKTGKSFSILRGGFGAKDHATGEGFNTWKFVASARPDWSKAEIAEWFFVTSGVNKPERGKWSKRSRREWLAQQRAESNLAAEKARKRFEQGKFVPSDLKLPEPLKRDSAVAQRFLIGMQPSAQREVRMAALAERRDWPLEWVEALVAQGELSWPELPWAPKHYVAWAVRRPDGKPVGYHQECWFQGRKTWAFIPYLPSKPAHNGFLEAMFEELGEHFTTIPPLPVVLGDWRTAKVWAITEGQWDAATLWGALGGFDDGESGELPIAVFGLRGVNGRGVMLQAYGAELRRRKPKIWLWPDNDEAGGKGLEATGLDTQLEKPGRLPDVRFTDQLRALVGIGARFAVTRVPKNKGKDFNDFWKAAKPTRQQLFCMMETLGLGIV